MVASFFNSCIFGCTKKLSCEVFKITLINRFWETLFVWVSMSKPEELTDEKENFLDRNKWI